MAPASSCNLISQTFVATDHERIEDTVTKLKLPRVTVYDRSPENAGDEASTESLMLEFIDAVGLEDEDVLVLIQATSPFTKTQHLQEAIELHLKDKKPVLSVCPFKRFVWTNTGLPVNYDPRNRPRRQDFESKYLVENGALYINSVKNIKETKNRIGTAGTDHLDVEVYVMPEHTILELDEPSDWAVAENTMRALRNITDG